MKIFHFWLWIICKDYRITRHANECIPDEFIVWHIMKNYSFHPSCARFSFLASVGLCCLLCGAGLFRLLWLTFIILCVYILATPNFKFPVSKIQTVINDNFIHPQISTSWINVSIKLDTNDNPFDSIWINKLWLEMKKINKFAFSRFGRFPWLCNIFLVFPRSAVMMMMIEWRRRKEHTKGFQSSRIPFAHVYVPLPKLEYDGK